MKHIITVIMSDNDGMKNKTFYFIFIQQKYYIILLNKLMQK